MFEENLEKFDKNYHLGRKAAPPKKKRKAPATQTPKPKPTIETEQENYNIDYSQRNRPSFVKETKPMVPEKPQYHHHAPTHQPKIVADPASEESSLEIEF